MGADYIPETDLFAALWMKFFARALVQNPTGYRTTPENAAEIEAVVHAFRLLNAQCHEPEYRTRSNISAKNSARLAAEKLVRPEAQRIRTDPRIDSNLKVLVGLNPERRRRQHVGVPESVPDLTIKLAKSDLIQIFVRDSQSNRRGRPRGASGIELYEHVHAVPVSVRIAGSYQGAIHLDRNGVPKDWRFVGIFTSTPFAIQPSSKTPGDVVSYVARWITRRGEPGAFGKPQSERVQFNQAPTAFMRTPIRHKLAS